MNLLWIFLGGGLGAASRWWLTGMITSDGFPYGTLTVNLVGCLLIGCMSVFLLEHPKLSLLLIMGFLGGFTTFSSFGLDAFKLLELKNYKTFFTYVMLSNVLGILLVILGHKLVSNII
ncbi:MAG: fluoride efflux transporter CrcB [Bacteroidetes bacterium]|nr:MAG: fluoride efflux transporter CrcB [Bacteroidota bacterium]